MNRRLWYEPPLPKQVKLHSVWAESFKHVHNFRVQNLLLAAYDLAFDASVASSV